ncbi:unnamed protein product [Chironomus riparius]|uniref:FHA domain-containing protein n=1 Tax=Chironomus riparius TaxID=315576 RepID=A0A9N9SA99_9DIPT|nr:unnamed protein product [Chironomus riparius]
MSFNPENFFLKRIGNCDFKVHYKNYTFLKAETKFGRGKDCDVVLKNMRCSLNHCKITFENGKLFIEDSSSAGTFVNNEKIRNKKVELFDGTIVGMGADPSRQDHVDKTNFYIYKVQKVEPPINLDSSDDEAEDAEKIPISSSNSKTDENLNVENINQIRSNQVAAPKKMTEIKTIKVGDIKESNETICLENDENSEDLTQKIHEHLTANERLKLEALDSSSKLIENDCQGPSQTHIKIEADIEMSTQKLMRLNNIFSAKSQETNHEKPQAKPYSADLNSSDNNTKEISPSSGSNVSAASTVVVSSAGLQPEWISSAFIDTSRSALDLIPEENSQTPPEPPIFAPGLSNFQLFPTHLTEVTSFKTLAQASDRQENQPIQPLSISENPNYLPSPSQLSETSTTVAPSPSTSGMKFSNLALRKKKQPSTSSSTTSAPTFLNYSPISSASNISSATLSTISSHKLQTFSRSSSTDSSTSNPISEEQSKIITPDEIKSKTIFLRHYGQQGSKLIDLPENPMNQTCDLLNEVEGPKETLPIFWKRGVAVVKTARKPKKKRGRPQKTSDKFFENSKETESKILKLKNSDLTSKTRKNLKSKNKSLKNQNEDLENGKPTSEAHIKSSNAPTSTRLKATARKTTNTGTIAVKRPFAYTNDNKSKSDDSDSSNEYQSAQSENSETESQDENKSKRQKTSTGQKAPNKVGLKKQDNLVTNNAESNKIVHVENPLKTSQGPNINSLNPTSSNSKKLFKFPDSDDDNSKNEESEPSKIAPKSGTVRARVGKIVQRRESIINLKRPLLKGKLNQYIQAQKSQASTIKRILNKGLPNDKRPAQHFHDKFPHLYQGLESDSKADSGSSTTNTASTGSIKSVPMRQRRQSVFEEQAQLIPENLTPNERINAIRRWHQNTTKLIDIPAEHPNKKKRGRPSKLNEDDKIKMLIERSKANDEKK